MKPISPLADVMQPSVGTSADLVQLVFATIASNQMEFLIIFSTMLAYFLLFRSRATYAKAQVNVAQISAQTSSRLLQTTPAHVQDKDRNDCHPSYTTLRVAISQGDHASVLRCWDTLQSSGEGPVMLLPDILKSMRVCKKSEQSVVNELRLFLLKHADQCDMSVISRIISHLGEELDTSLMKLILDMLPSISLQPDQQTYETILKVYVAARDYPAIQDTVAKMHATAIPLSARAVFLIMKGALQAQDLVESMRCFEDLKASWKVQPTSEPLLPQGIMILLVELACKKQQLGQLVQDLHGLPLPEKTIDALLGKCVELHDPETAKFVESLARAQRERLHDSTYSLLLRAMNRKPLRVRGIIEEVMARDGSTFSPDLALAVLDACKGTSDVKLVNRLYEKMKPKQINVLSAFIWFYIANEQFEKACDVYELDMEPVHNNVEGSQVLDPNLQESIVDAAVVCGRNHMAERLVASSSSNSAGAVASMQKGFLCTKQLVEHIIASFERWHAVISYWVVLVL
jgi:hypothetical protein